MKGLPYFCWYPADAEMDGNYRSMSDTEVGFYHRCLNLAWIECGLPADLDEMALLMGRPIEQVSKLWRRVGRCFVVDPERADRLINPRQEIERADAIAKSLTARASANVRWSKKKAMDANACKSDANALSSHCEGNARAYDSSESFQEIRKTSISGDFENWRIDENFVKYRDCYLSRGAIATEADWVRCWNQWKPLDFQQKLNAIAYVSQCDPAWVKLPQNVLKDREWTRPPRPEPKSKAEKIMEAI